MRERGFLHADGYAGFNGLYEPDAPSGEARLVGVACSAHSRRKLFELHAATGSVIAPEALMVALFKIEAVRQELSLPLLVDLKDFLAAALAKISRKARSPARSATAFCAWMVGKC